MNRVRITEQELRNLIAESVQGVLNEIGDTPAGQWMLGRLAGRQRNREYPDEVSLYTLPIRSQGKISKTTTDANDYGDDDYDSPFQRGFDLENNKWRGNYPDFDSHHADEREESLRGYGDAMTSMIQHHSNKALKESNNNQYICQKKVRLTEGELRSIIRTAILEAVDESGIGLIGARNAAMANLKKRIGLGVRKRIRPDGSVEDQQQRYNDREKSMIEDINKKFVEEFGTEGADLPCSAWYFGIPVYSFHFKVKRIEQINAHNFSFVGDFSVDNIDAVPETLRPVVIPRNPNNVILVYTFAKREMKFTRKKTGLTMTPHNDGSNGWNKLLKFVGTYNEGYSIVAR